MIKIYAKERQFYTKRRLFSFFLLIAVTIAGFYYTKKQEKGEFTFGVQQDTKESLDNLLKDEIEEKISVEVSGAVLYPGVYELTKRNTLADAIQKAGGFALEADESKLNLADSIFHGECIYIPFQGDTKESYVSYSHLLYDFSAEVGKTESPKKININQANKRELQSLPFIGEKIAENIIRYRQEYGDFQSIEEIKNVPKIGDKIFEAIQNDIEVP
ncbi:MAG: hypothetical protein GX299_10725 [Epulopiscium sp.]|nr:hypothetical protein [Candidatus Epulonipiscium sp.]